MSKKTTIKFLNIVMILLLFLISACEMEETSSVFNPNETGNLAPVITGVEPAAVGLAGYTEIKILGINFSAHMDSVNGNTVYFGTVRAKVLSASSTELTVLAPSQPGDSLVIKVSVPGAFNIAEYSPYTLMNILYGVGNKASVDKVYAIAVDGDENVYGFIKSGSKGTVFKYGTDGSTTELGAAPFPLVTDMKVGPGGYLYMLYGYQYLYRMNLTDGTIENYMTLPERVNFMDFDRNHNIYTGGRRKGIIVTDVNGTEGRIVGDFLDFNINCIRVFGDEVYIAAKYSGSNTSFPAEGIYKAQITSANGDLGETMAVFDWSNAGDHSSSAMESMTFDEIGNILVGTNNKENPIIIISVDGNTEILYPGKLNFSVGQIVYGNGQHLYQNKTVSDMDSYTIDKILTPFVAAPYYGRD